MKMQKPDAMTIRLTRENITGSEDTDAHHDRMLEVSDGCAISEIVDIVLLSSYIPTVPAGRATWIAYADDHVVAVVAQEWIEPKYIVPPDRRYEHLANLDFEYAGQHSPDDVFATMAARARTRDLE